MQSRKNLLLDKIRRQLFDRSEACIEPVDRWPPRCGLPVENSERLPGFCVRGGGGLFPVRRHRDWLATLGGHLVDLSEVRNWAEIRDLVDLSKAGSAPPVFPKSTAKKSNTGKYMK